MTEILQVAIPTPLATLFDYLPLPEQPLPPIGGRVKVPFGRRECIGIVMHYLPCSQVPIHKLKPIIAAIDAIALLPNSLCQLLQQAQAYYHHPIGEVMQTGLPSALRQGQPMVNNLATWSMSPITDKPQLTPAQQDAVTQIISATAYQAFLLDGVTGSGKTEVYLQALEHCVAQGKQALILVPEISLTPQTAARFQNRFTGLVGLFHSRLTPKQRFTNWCAARFNQLPIMVGTRSALFLPFTQLGLIIVDEEHDSSFKQQEGFRYSARDMAVLRAKLTQIPIVLGSATPSFESLVNAQQQKYQSLRLTERIGRAGLAQGQLLDIRHKKLDGGLSAQLIQAIREHLAQQGQVLLFLNRRGYAPVWMCFDCGWLAKCQHCDARFTYHLAEQRLSCHHCGATQAIATHCPQCQSGEIHPFGIGTERLEATLSRLFPEIPLVRIDSDVTKRKGALQQKLQQIVSEKAQILIGTQLLAKGHHFPKLTLVAIVDADYGLFSSDFRALERLAQLLTQVAGRAGRSDQTGKVLLQTFQPEHPLLHLILQQDYHQVAKILLQERQANDLPPYGHLALFRAQARHVATPQALLSQFKQAIQPLLTSTLQVMGPIPAPMARRQGQHRFQLLVQAHSRTQLQHFLRHALTVLTQQPLIKKVRWSLDVDPQEML